VWLSWPGFLVGTAMPTQGRFRARSVIEDRGSYLRFSFYCNGLGMID